jgi:plastocyanin
VTATTAPDRTRTRTGVRPIALVGQAVAILAVAAALVLAVTRGGRGTSGASEDRARVHEYTVPFGTGQRLDAGEDVRFFPAKLVVHVGDELVVHNLDNRSQQIGPYLVDRGETMQQTFTEPGVITGVCTIHPSGRVEIDVLR